jgi:hypothetical protein
VYEAGAHGMSFFQPDFDPKTTQNILDFILLTLGD